MTKRSFARLGLAAVAFAMFAARPADADIILDVEFDSSSLAAAGSPPAPFYLALTLIDGDGVFDENQLTIGEFNVAGVGGPATEGGASGSLATSVVLVDSEFFNDFYQGFVVGDLLKFSITVKEPVVAVGSTPDRFVFSILDQALLPLPTTDLADSALVAFDLLPGTLPIETYGSAPGTALDFPAPIVTIRQTVIPEPASLAMLGAGLAGLGALGLRRRRAA